MLQKRPLSSRQIPTMSSASSKRRGYEQSIWHYLPVFVERDGGIEYSICEVYLDDDGCVASWTESSSIAASGETADELRADLSHMLNDVARWEPVRFSDLAVGLRLRPADSHSSSPDSHSRV